MFVHYLKKLFKRSTRHTPPAVIARPQHRLSRRLISPNALKVLYHLKRHGFDAYLVGGSIRDILLNVKPKDFDIATNAHPEQIKHIFHNCLLIGRRFRIAHIRFPKEVIEVTTFRAAASNSYHRRLSTTGMLLRDNVYGTIHEDVWRRDFSMNALYYNIRDFSLVDYCRGLEDIRNKTIRIIGNPKTRYQEDPVRLLRAIRLAAKFPAFQFEPATEQGLQEQSHLLAAVPNTRLFEELLKLFHSGFAVAAYRLLQRYQLNKEILIGESGDTSDAWIERALKHTDQRFHTNQSLSPAFLFSVLLWPSVQRETDRGVKEEMPYMMAYLQAIKTVTARQHQLTSLTRFCSQMMREIWLLQPALVKQNPKQLKRLLAHPRFRAAYDFLLLRAEHQEVLASVAHAWTARVEEAQKKALA